jgi:8-oxo-dGTP pyrophosphatase MutT (NUDIX family)
MELSWLAEHDPVAVTGEPRSAAVLVPVVDRPAGEHVLFVKRADHLGEHAGQMAFPGGGHEPGDADLLATALREADEEIGLRPGESAVAGRLDDIRTVSEYSVRPFVATVPDRAYAPDEREVAEVAMLPVSGLTDLDNYRTERRDHPHYGDIRLHFFRVDGYTVWGATGRMLVQLLELTTDWSPPPDESVERVDPDADLPV